MNEPLLVAKSVHKTYLLGKRSLEVLRGVDLELQKGEFLALRGASGAGKSTLLHLLGGLDSPNRGEIMLAGRNLAELSSRELARLRNKDVAFIFQAYYLMPELDALENVCLPARMARVTPAEAEARGRELLARVGLEQRMEHKPYELSGGEQQRVAIARALINRPDILLADEPTGNLDSQHGAEIIGLLKTLVQEFGHTVLLVTHSAAAAEAADYVWAMRDGRLMTRTMQMTSAQGV